MCSSSSKGRGIIILIGISLCSPISAFFTGLGSAVGMLVAFLLGAPTSEIAAGLYGYDAALSCCAVGGVFFVLV